MRRLLFALLLIASSASGAEPKASLSGPESALTRTIIRLDPAGSVSDKKLLLRLTKGPERVTPEPLFNRAGSLVCFEVVPTRVGAYEFVAVAISDDPEPLFDFAFWTVVVTGGNGPTPTPVVVTPAPPVVQPPPVVVPPPPVPAPPPPSVQRVSAPLFAFLAYTNDPADPGFREFAAVINDPNLSPALKQLGVDWYAWPFNTPNFDTQNLRPYIGNGGPPVLLIYDAAGKVYDQSGNEVNRVGAAFRPPADSAAIVGLFKRLRGQ